MIHPRRLKGMPANIARYYTVGDYYTKGGDEPSLWGGAIAPDLGLKGVVDPTIFKELLAGRVDGRQLGRWRAGGEIDHHPGWDFAVNAPKSVSIMALVMGDERILEAHERAVGVALSYLEEHAALRRRDKGEVVQETTGRLLFARFTEHASRELDPHLHSHVVVLNLTNGEPGAPMASLETRAMFAEQMVAGQIYRNELSHDIKSFGYEIDHDPRSGLFEIRGVPQDLIRDFSQRAEEINVHAKEHGLTGQAARRESFYATRPKKETIDLAQLHERWEVRSRAHATILGNVRDAADRDEAERPASEPAPGARAALFGMRQAETGEAVNNLGHILRHGLAAFVGEVRLADIRPPIEAHEDRRKLLATHEQTGDAVLTRGRTSRKTARMEQRLTRHIIAGLDDARPVASADRLLPVLERAGLTPEQEQALVKVATSRDRLNAIQGVAGSGKSTLARILKEAADPGTRFMALAPTSSAAAKLGDDAGMEARTVASLLARGGRGLSENHVLVLDEAGQLGSRQAMRILEISRTTGARLLLLGDDKQTGAIEQGKPFWLLQRLGLPTAQLTQSVRQETGSMKAAVSAARAGDYSLSFSHLDKIAIGDTAEDLAKALVGEWTRLRPETRNSTNILVLDNSTRLIVNAEIRDTLKREGAIAAQDHRLEVLTPTGMTDAEKQMARFYSEGQVVRFGQDQEKLDLARDTEYRVLGLGREPGGRQIVRLTDEHGRIIRWDPRLVRARTVNVFLAEERPLSAGDRIQWRLANKDLDLKNAERGTVKSLDGSIATIRWDRGKRTIEVDLSRHKNWDHGYAETVYSAQSKTYARVYVLAPVGSPLVNAQNYYTAITRARFGVKLWTEDSKKLAERLDARSGEKSSSLEGLGRLDRDSLKERQARQAGKHRAEREQQQRERREQQQRASRRRPAPRPITFSDQIAGRAAHLAARLDLFLRSRTGQQHLDEAREEMPAPSRTPPELKRKPDRGPER